MRTRFTEDARTVLVHADGHACRLGHRRKRGEHLRLRGRARHYTGMHEEEIVRLEGLGAGAVLGVSSPAIRTAILGRLPAGLLLPTTPPAHRHLYSGHARSKARRPSSLAAIRTSRETVSSSIGRSAITPTLASHSRLC